MAVRNNYPVLKNNTMKNILKYAGMSIVIGVVGGFIVYAFLTGDLAFGGGGSDPNRLDGTITNSRVNVASASSTTILSANSARKYAAIVNNCNYDIFLGVGTTASKAYGIRLNKQGGAYEINTDNLIQRSISGIASTSDGTDYCKVTTLDAE